jgi:gamma-glutamyl hercynylcysteine S-oxide synthase
LQLLQMVDGYELPEAVKSVGCLSPGQLPVQLDRQFEYPPVREMPRASGTIHVAGGQYAIGTPATGFAYDNERPRQMVELAPFEIDSWPVTNREYAQFVEDTGTEPPLYWERDGDGGWVDTAMGRREQLDPELAAIHVSWHGADAFARWAGKRLPSEQEWEAAARSTDPDGDEPPGLPGAGQVWEWTASDFLAYPGFEAFPYEEYSQVFFGDTYKVLRGGSWATHREDLRLSFRNWDLPRRRQIFSGFRCARSAGEAG